jgi:hypothetical protein
MCPWGDIAPPEIEQTGISSDRLVGTALEFGFGKPSPAGKWGIDEDEGSEIQMPPSPR